MDGFNMFQYQNNQREQNCLDFVDEYSQLIAWCHFVTGSLNRSWAIATTSRFQFFVAISIGISCVSTHSQQDTTSQSFAP